MSCSWQGNHSCTGHASQTLVVFHLRAQGLKRVMSTLLCSLVEHGWLYLSHLYSATNNLCVNSGNRSRFARWEPTGSPTKPKFIPDLTPKMKQKADSSSVISTSACRMPWAAHPDRSCCPWLSSASSAEPSIPARCLSSWSRYQVRESCSTMIHIIQDQYSGTISATGSHLCIMH